MPKVTPSPDPSLSEPLRWGILATGRIARQFVTDLHASGAGRAVACGSRTVESARAFATSLAIPKAYGSYGELARDPEVEAVYVATPHSLHFEAALACLRNGKAVLCEKPLTVNAAQATALFDAAEEAGVFLMEALWSYCLPGLLQARQWWTSGAIGEVRLVQASMGFANPYEPKSRFYDPALAGGALLDLGVYPVSLAQLVAGNKVPKVKASARLAPTGVDETTSVLLDWSSGLRAELSCSQGHRLANEARIHGTKGTILLPEFWKAETAILETADSRTVWEDRRTTAGYDFEARVMTEGVRAGRPFDGLLSRTFSVRLATTLDAVRKQIGVVYPADA